jgi:hypothetical protein
MVPLDELKWIQFPKSRDDLGSAATVRSQTGVENSGHVIKLLSDLEADGLVAQVLVEVHDPFCLAKGRTGNSPLFLGEYAHVDIQGTTVNNVFAITRDALRDGSKVWLVTGDGQLDILSPEIVWRGLDTVFVRDLPEGQYLVTSALATPVQGMNLDLNVVDPIPGADRHVADATDGTREVASLETK